MKLQYTKTAPKITSKMASVYLLKNHKSNIKLLNRADETVARKRLEHEQYVVLHSGATTSILINLAKIIDAEDARKCGHAVVLDLKKIKLETALIFSLNSYKTLALIEGMALSCYQFLKYFADRQKRAHKLNKIIVTGETSYQKELKELSLILKAVYSSRDLVNEPLSFLTASQLGKEIKRLSKVFGFKAEVFGKTKIESLKMGGILAVNRGSEDPPSFSILEWKPKNAQNKKPLVLVGKGVVYDTGGLSLKPTPNSMDFMKSDMGGAAAVVGAMCAIAGNDLPYHVIVLVPSTDNRPGKNAYVPGDVVTMYSGTTVEVLNTDAEGRMLLADALAYARKYTPELVIDAATLTGSAVSALGKEAIVGMGNAGVKEMSAMKKAGDETCERVVEFPFWDEYADQIKSTIADIKNLGGPTAGSITAGKFLEKFTDYPYIHLDIAGPAFMHSEWNYRGNGGTGVGVRLLYQFVKNRVM